MRFKIVIFKNKVGKWLWHLKSYRNGRIIAHSESYSSKTKAVKTASLINDNLQDCVLKEG